VGWNRQKRAYDLTILAAVAIYLAAFIGLGVALRPAATAETLLIRGLGTAALILLHVVLLIGPLCRLQPKFLPLLYNRRHLGVTMFLLALGHGLFALVQFHALGDTHPLLSLLTSNVSFASLGGFPFELPGLLALAILLLMAATSHDFWLANLTPPVWKSLHMLVYVAYGLLLAHVALGVLQDETSPLLLGGVAMGVAAVVSAHLAAGLRERAADREQDVDPAAAYVDVCSVDEIEEKRARVVCLSGERVAIFRYDGRISAVSSVCQHQNGPLGEGRIIDGCITCPWHGYQYLPESGASPPPFTEKIPTFAVQVQDRRVRVRPTPLPPGTRVEPARIAPESTGG
jgi:nitrite reductase/ring-hydroxylating ferredoxin subunit/DMSO/TMAO reductase YedYZ heme-binding membrane subunit